MKTSKLAPVGVVYATGNGAEKDLDQTLKWFRNLAPTRLLAQSYVAPTSSMCLHASVG